MTNTMNSAAFDAFALEVAKQHAPYATAEMSNGTLFVAGCTPREAAKMGTAFEYKGIGVIVTPGAEYSFDFV